MSELKVELLAPAGNKEAFLGAIHAGADAVYLAGNKYGARAYADNFTEEELLFCIRYAHIWGRKVYMTVNTLLKEWELSDLYEYLLPYYEAGLDACIVQDLGVFQYIKEHFPLMELHVSTQMTITGAYGATFLKELGATRIVPARELSLEEISLIKKQTDLEMETFIHGAMCYCYSGQCLFSSILGGRSGNRGKCAQPCRLPYSVDVDGEKSDECYPLSLKDMCTLEHLDALLDAGIDSFKIEGRMKKPEYAAGVTAIYRKYIDDKKMNPQNKLKIEKADLENLSRLYIRSERQDGYYFKQNGADMITLQSPAYSGSDDKLIKNIREKYIDLKPRMPISVYAEVVCGRNAVITLLCGEHSVSIEGEMVTAAQKQPVTEENIVKQISKLGDTCFEAEQLQVITDGQSFYPLKALNELRRQAVYELENLIIESYGLVYKRESQAFVKDSQILEKPKKDLDDIGKQISIQVSTIDQLRAVEEFIKREKCQVQRVYIESELLLNKQVTTGIPTNILFIALPYCLRQKDISKIEKLVAYARNHDYNGFLVRNIEEYAYLRICGYKGELIADAGLYVWNSYTKEFWKERLDVITCPYELNRKEYTKLFSDQSYEKVVYGRLPMMITANCIRKTIKKCVHAEGKVTSVLKDRYHKEFPVISNCEYCYNIIYNSLPISLHKDLDMEWDKNIKRLMFTVESKRETELVLKYFKSLADGFPMEMPIKEYTTAHERRGVE